MKVNVQKIDDVNMIFSANIKKSDLDQKIKNLASIASKSIKVDGFRKGKVPIDVVKKLHGEKLAADAEGEAIREVLSKGNQEAKLKQGDLIGEPIFKKFERKGDGIDVEIAVSTKPTFELGDYKAIAPKFEKPTVSAKAVDERLEGILKNQAPFEPIAKKRALKEGDMAVLDFVGSIDGVEFDGGKAEGFSLIIGSKQLIAGFEEQMVGMKAGEEKSINVTFPKEYNAPDLAGKEAEFKLKLHEIKEKATPELNDELASKLLYGKEGANVAMLKEEIKAQLEREEVSKKYHQELKPKMVESLVKKYDFALPNNIVEQEIDVKVNQRASAMSKEEIDALRGDEAKIQALRDEVRDEAQSSVKATFIVDALAKSENITVDDQEVTQVIYYEAVMQGQDPQKIMEYYMQNNLMPAIKMGIVEDKLFSKLLGIEE